MYLLGLEYCIFDFDHYGLSIIFSFVVNRSGSETSSAANQRSYIALGQLHGPYVNHPLDLIKFTHT